MWSYFGCNYFKHEITRFIGHASLVGLVVSLLLIVWCMHGLDVVMSNNNILTDRMSSKESIKTPGKKLSNT